MPLVSEICEYLDRLAPPQLAEDWDNVGLLIGRRSDSVDSVLTCLTLTPDVAGEARDGRHGLIVTHHPVLFRGTKRMIDDTAEGRMLLDLIQAGVAVYSAHTRFDSARDGINQQLADGFGLVGTGPLRPSEVLPGLGSGRYGRLPQRVSLPEFLRTVRAVTGAGYLEYAGAAEATVSVVGIACGAAGEFLDDAIAAGCDTFVTGETRFHTALEARTRGVSLILPGHYASERRAMEWLAEQLAAVFPDLAAQASERETDPLQIHVPDAVP